MVLTCRPCSSATPTGNKRGTSTTRHLDAETNWPGAELILDCPRDGADENAIGAAATISKQHGATSSTTGSASPPAASGWTSPPAAKNTAAGAMTAARTADDFRRSLANSCLPTASTLRANRGICHEVVTTLSQNSDRFSRSPFPDGNISAGQRPRRTHRDTRGHIGSASQAEYAGSIPVIGSTNP